MKITHHNTVADWPDIVVDIPGQADIGADQAGIGAGQADKLGAGLQAGHMPVVLEDKAGFAFDRVEDTPFQDQLYN